MAEAEARKDEGGGVPAWVMTFADLMTLLMCFFVLLLSFSEMDVAKFKQLSGSMKEAFGVQAEIEARTIPKGTSIIAQEFSPGKPEPTPVNQVRQFTIDTSKNTLDAMSEERAREEARRQARRLTRALADEISDGSIAVEVSGARITIHIRERASFPSGSADVRPDFLPVIQEMAGLIVSNDGQVTVAGHTDNVPISTDRFRSNWDLSTARAVSVAHELLENAPLDETRFVVIGHADTRPLAPNDTVENRARNRRVDISIVRGDSIEVETDRSPEAVAADESEGAAPNE